MSIEILENEVQYLRKRDSYFVELFPLDKRKKRMLSLSVERLAKTGSLNRFLQETPQKNNG